MAHTFHTEQWLPFDIELVFAFFANPENLPRLMPKWQSARIEEAHFKALPPRPDNAPRYPGIVAGDGTRLLLSLRPFPLAPARITWEALIEDFRWNHGFCDIQLRGPFRSWRHCHTVRPANDPATGRPGTIVRDKVTYESIGGPLMKPGLAYIFRYRHQRTAELLALATGHKQ